MSGATAPGLPAEAVDAARQTLGGAAAVAEQFPGTATHTLLATARDAYSSGMHSASLAGAAVLLLTGLFALRALRNEPVPAAPEKPESPEKGKHAKNTEETLQGEGAEQQELALV